MDCNGECSAIYGPDESEAKIDDPAVFKDIDRSNDPSTPCTPGEPWTTILESPCTFPPEIFSDVMLNFIENPNVTSSHLFRADVFYDSSKDPTTSVDDDESVTHGQLVRNLKAAYQPQDASLSECILDRTIVRQLVPRNPQLDKALVQTCHFFHQRDLGAEERHVVMYTPHVETEDEIPFYHPKVKRLAFEHHWSPSGSPSSRRSISISIQLFPQTTLDNRLSRTALKLLQTAHKHGQGRLAGYEKRVQLDRILPQKRYQDTYTRLKTVYGKKLASQWVEVTDPGKHVFEDIGIAAFLIELWRDMYALPSTATVSGRDSSLDSTLPPFPGFVDMGCGNGVLTYILLSEGYPGCGFDARERKTWRIFPAEIQSKLQQRILVPAAFQDHIGKPKEVEEDVDKPKDQGSNQHNGIFDKGTFIISNHADELTAWTPLLAYLNTSAFIAIPCCSHDFSGARFRAPAVQEPKKGGPKPSNPSPSRQTTDQSTSTGPPNPTSRSPRQCQAAETGSLARRTPASTKNTSCNHSTNRMPSAYSTLCAYVSRLTDEMGFEPETEILRIPSTRNTCILGRRQRGGVTKGLRGREESGDRDGVGEAGGGSAGVASDCGDGDVGEETGEEKMELVRRVVEREMGRSIGVVGKEWRERALKLEKKPGSGH